MDWEEKAIVAFLRQEQRQREMAARYARPERQASFKFSNRAEIQLMQKLEGMGYVVHTTTHKCPWDLWVGNCRVECKASHWQKANRYQANIRHHDADLLIFNAVNGQDHYFIIPMCSVAPRRSIEVYSYNISKYSGQWSLYLEAWDVLEQAVNNAPDRPIQLSLGFIR